jgi:hypothetical protein
MRSSSLVPVQSSSAMGGDGDSGLHPTAGYEPLQSGVWCVTGDL